MEIVKEDFRERGPSEDVSSGLLTTIKMKHRKDSRIHESKEESVAISRSKIQLSLRSTYSENNNDTLFSSLITVREAKK